MKPQRNTTHCVVCESKIESNSLLQHQEEHIALGGIKVTNDLSQSVKTRCHLCPESDPFPLHLFRSHTRKQHNLAIAEYKDMYQVELVERVYHQCGLCRELVILDSDTMYGHLQRHKPYTVKQYNEQFMIKTKSSSTEKRKRPRKSLEENASPNSSIASSNEDFNGEMNPVSMFSFPELVGRVSKQWLTHEEMHLVSWPHTCLPDGMVASLEMEVLDTEGLPYIVI